MKNMFNYDNIYKVIITSGILLYNSIYVDTLQQRIRDTILIRQKNTCGSCHTKFSDKVPHEIHHLNHNSSDNNLNNLLALCCNCHAAHHRFNMRVKPFFPDIEYLSYINNVKPYHTNISK